MNNLKPATKAHYPWILARAARSGLLLGIIALLASCFQASRPSPAMFAAEAYPERLSQWNLLYKSGDQLELGTDVQVYDINMPLFSDYAGKLRTLWLPPNTQLTARSDGSRGFDYPVGTILSKTFFYESAGASQDTGPQTPLVVAQTNTYRSDGGPLTLAERVPVETRLMVKHPDGWHAVSYRWQGDEAYLAITGAIVPMRLANAEGETNFSYLIPSRNQCAGCHATNHSTGRLVPIGLHHAQLERPSPANPALGQLASWQQRGWLQQVEPASMEPLPSWEQEGAKPDALARAYLDSNCGHCHNPNGPADTSALDLSHTNQEPASLGICKPPIAAGRGSGGHLYGIVPGNPDASILVHRLASTDLRSRMPEVGRSLKHAEGVELVRAWIASIAGECR